MKDRTTIWSVASVADYTWCEFCGLSFRNRENRNQHTKDEHL